ncbi:amino acid permease [Candidatus Woesearchaeota archaeon]|nr:amino acid permease [Candidatus Woesearchaeota archaeon]
MVYWGLEYFFLPAVGAREAGLFAIISWLIMGLIAIMYSMVFGELVSRYPKEGGVFEYAKEAFGFFPSFLLGWMTLIAANVTIAMLMVGAIKYVGPNLSNLFIAGISILFILAFNFVAFKGLKTGKVMLLTFAGITLVAVLGILIPGLINFNPANFTNWLSHESFAGFGFNVSGLVGGSVIIFGTIFFIAETFFGWETVTFLAEQVKNPKKIMPNALVKGTVLISIFSLLFVIASKSILHWSVLANSSTPLADLASAVYGPAMIPVYSILVYLAIIGSVAGWIVAAPNLLVALAKDKLFIPSFAKKHPKTGTPYKAILFQTIVTSVLVIIGAGSYETLLHLLVPLVLVLYGSVVLSLLYIRKKNKEFDGYKAPGGLVLPIFLLLFTLALVLMWGFQEHNAIETVEVLITFLVLGIPVFLLMNFHHNPHASVTFQNKTVGLSKFLERLFLPKKIRVRLLEKMENHHKVLFLGAGSGILIKESSIPKENIIVIEHSESLANHLKNRFPTIAVIHDEHAVSRLHPDIKKADVVVSVGMLAHIQSLSMHLKQLHNILPENALIRFFDYSKFYKVISNNIPEIDELKKVFRENGFSVRVEEIKGIFWNYLIIEGVKTDLDVVYM